MANLDCVIEVDVYIKFVSTMVGSEVLFNIFKSAALLGLVVLSAHWFYRVLVWVWIRPKRLEKILRDQGFKGNPYRPFLGDQYWSEKLIRDALSRPIGIDEDVNKRIIPHVVKTVEQHGKKSFMWVGRIPRVFATEPDQVREIYTKYYMFHKNHHDLDPITKLLLTGIGSLEGETWNARRKILNPAFYYEKLKLLPPAFFSSCLDMVSKWDAKVPEGTPTEVEVLHDIETLTVDVMSKTLFGCDFDEGRVIFKLMNELTNLTIDVILSVYIPGKRFLPTRRNRRMKAIDKEVKMRIGEVIDKKVKLLKAGDPHAANDFLGILAESGLSKEQITNEVKLVCFAGEETTASLLVWTMILLSSHPEWQQKARDEVLQTFGDKEPDYDGLSKLKIVPMILNEVLRMYPPVPEVTKVAHEDTQLGDYFIPAGVQLMMPQLLLHYDKEIWGDDVSKFNPDRFSEGVLKATESQLGCYFPFSLGPRMCIGVNFALLEAKMAMALILRRFSFTLSPSYRHAPKTLFTIKPQYGAHVIMQKI